MAEVNDNELQRDESHERNNRSRSRSRDREADTDGQQQEQNEEVPCAGTVYVANLSYKVVYYASHHYMSICYSYFHIYCRLLTKVWLLDLPSK